MNAGGRVNARRRGCAGGLAIQHRAERLAGCARDTLGRSSRALAATAESGGDCIGHFRGL
jgi:hypothetical protein